MSGVKKIGAWVSEHKEDIKDIAVGLTIGTISSIVIYSCGLNKGFVLGEKHQTEMFAKLLK